MSDNIDEVLWGKTTEANQLMKENGVSVRIGYSGIDDCWLWHICIGKDDIIFADFSCDDETTERFIRNLKIILEDDND